MKITQTDGPPASEMESLELITVLLTSLCSLSIHCLEQLLQTTGGYFFPWVINGRGKTMVSDVYILEP